MTQELEDYVNLVEQQIEIERTAYLISRGIIRGLQIAFHLPLTGTAKHVQDTGSAAHLRDEIEKLIERMDPR